MSSDHGPYSNEIDVDWRAKGPLESGGELEPNFVSSLVESVSEWDLLLVVSWQQANLVVGGINPD